MKQYTLLTNSGINKLLKTASDGSKIALKEIVVSDYDGELSEQTASIPNEKYRGAINAITIDESDSNILDVDVVIPPEVGGFYIKTAGIYCDDGSLFAVARLADTYKPLLNEGSSKDITLNFKLQIANANDSIVLKVDNNVVLATRKWITARFAKLNENNRFIKNQMVDGYVIANHYHMKMKTQDEFVDDNIDICFRASQPVITDNPTPFRFMSLSKLKEAVNVGVAHQSECDDKYAKLDEYNRFTQNQMVDGYVVANHYHMKMKTQDEFVDGNIDICFRASQPVITDNPTPFRFMSLNKLKEAVKPQLAASFSQSGYVTLDNGLIIQWGVVGGDGEKNFPIAFPRACFMVVAGNADAQGDTADNAFAYPISKEKFYYATKVTNVYKVIAGYPGSFIAIGW